MFKPSMKIAGLILGAVLSLGSLSAAHAEDFGGRGHNGARNTATNIQGHEQSFRGHDMHKVSHERHVQHHRHHRHHGHHAQHGGTQRR